MSNLHNHLDASGYKGHDLERLLVRVMFCLFAEDTGIFPMESFLRLIEDRTEEDGSDLGGWLVHLFQVLNTPPHKRQSNLDEDLALFPYVNGNLFAEAINIPSFDSRMRNALLKCSYFNWSKVSPALFGSLFQAVMLPEAQRREGAHYTSEKNILKLIHPLFLDELHDEFKRIKMARINKQQKLEQLQNKLSKLTFLDPACGCGNFLILAFRELRELELEILEELYPSNNRQAVLDISNLTKITVDQFYGIEISEFPARIAEAAMWLVDHQMNMKLSERFGQAYIRLPLTKSAYIYHGNALTIEWSNIIHPEKCSYILGNPPFIGKKEQNEKQKSEIIDIFKNVDGKGVLDYVACWYMKASQYISGTKIKVAFVSTKSISQGEQVSILWNELLRNKCEIFFAHKVFKWTIDEKKANGMKIASVHVIIIGFSTQSIQKKTLYEYDNELSDPHAIIVKKINPYLVEGDNILVLKRTNPICNVLEINKGSEATDFGFLILSKDEMLDLINKEPMAAKFIRRYVGSKELLHNIERYCLWLTEASPSELKSMPLVMSRINAVKRERQKSKKTRTVEWAKQPALFSENRQPVTDYLAIPKVSSKSRDYIPIGFLSKDFIASGSIQTLANATFYDFGILSSSMHMSWMRYVAGRTKSDYQYSNTIVYNNFPWPDVTKQHLDLITQKAKNVLEARDKFSTSCLADLYDPNTMPSILLKAHKSLDKEVDKAYRRAAFKTEDERIQYLLNKYKDIVE